jgi:peptidoglycan/LPS O-acetylase OafA/YrhL
MLGEIRAWQGAFRSMGTNVGEYRLGFRGDIEGLRAIAILLVIGAHAGMPWLGGGFVGVDVFFVLSGFLITGLLVQEIADTGQLRFADFYIRRLRRLLPALIVMLLVSGLLAALLLAPAEQLPQATAGASAAAWWSNIHFALGRLDYFSAGTETNIFLHTWSLGVEEQFYLIWPALVYVLLRNPARQIGIARLRVCMLLVIVASLIACVVATYRAPQFAFYMMPLRAWQFAAGALVWLHFNAGQTEKNEKASSRTSGVMLAAIGWLGLAALLGAGLWLGANVPYPGLYALIPTLGAAGVIASGSRGVRTGVPKLLSYGPMQAIGRISYAWYLWHWPILLLGHALTGSNEPVYRVLYVLISLILAIVSYYCVEAPIRHQRWWLTHQRASVYGALVVMVLCTVGFLRWNGHAYWASRSPTQVQFLQARGDAPMIYGMDCDEWYHSDRLTPCIFGPAKPAHTAVLLGDSIAGQWFPAVAALFVGPDWRLIVLTKSSCPMVDQPMFYPRIGREYTECAAWRKAALQEIAKLRPDIVLMSSTSTYAFTQAQWTNGSARVMKEISSAAGRVFVIRATPLLPFDGPDCLARYAERPEWLKLGSTCSTAIGNLSSNQVYAWLRQAAEQFQNVQTVDISDFICPNGICAAERGGVIVFRDSQHMTATFAASLAPELERRLHLNNVSAGGLDAGGAAHSEQKASANFR